jgi:Trypsin-like serine proteases, typically periplasmic, contain C-terminal PDZ domain
MKLTAMFENALDDLMKRIRGVLVVVNNEHQGAGAGVLAGDGLVLTNNHVAGDGHALEVTLDDGGPYKAKVIKRKVDADLALLQISDHGHAGAIFSTQEPRPGEMVFAYGHPWGQRNVLTGGILSAVTTARTRRGELTILRSDVQLAPGNSGGPLLNAAGEVLGLNAMILGGDQSVAIPASVIREFLAEAHKNMPRSKAPEDVL